MRILFWGAQAHCGTTANMRAVAGMMGMMYPGWADAGGPGMFRSTKRLSLCDGGSGDVAGKERMWGQADLVVVNLCRDVKSIESFFESYPILARKSFVLLSSFPQEGTGSVAELVYRYRLGEEACGMIGENAAYYLAAGRGRSREFVEKECRHPGSLRNEQFLCELERTAERIVRFAERNMERRHFVSETIQSGQPGQSKQFCESKLFSQDNSVNQSITNNSKRRNEYGTGNETLWKCNSCSYRTSRTRGDSRGGALV